MWQDDIEICDMIKLKYVTRWHRNMWHDDIKVCDKMT
jgi:hypothetical protein